MKTLALILALLSSLPLRATIISSFQRLDPTTEPTTLTHNFSGGGPVWANYTFLFAGIQDYLVGGDLLRTSYYDGSDPDFQLRVTLDVPATVFLIIDNHVPDVVRCWMMVV